jgi:hypothetical protein
MKYRAEVINPLPDDLGRQNLGDNYDMVLQWAIKKANATNCVVVIFETVEIVKTTVQPQLPTKIGTI